jgi:hypothetical protein
MSVLTRQRLNDDEVSGALENWAYPLLQFGRLLRLDVIHMCDDILS